MPRPTPAAVRASSKRSPERSASAQRWVYGGRAWANLHSVTATRSALGRPLPGGTLQGVDGVPSRVSPRARTAPGGTRAARAPHLVVADQVGLHACQLHRLQPLRREREPPARRRRVAVLEAFRRRRHSQLGQLGLGG
eukprot:5637771-Prymnesium_polylepis.1